MRLIIVPTLEMVDRAEQRLAGCSQCSSPGRISRFTRAQREPGEVILSNPGTLRQPPSPEMLSTWPAANQRSAASGAVAGAAALIGHVTSYRPLIGGAQPMTELAFISRPCSLLASLLRQQPHLSDSISHLRNQDGRNSPAS